MFKYSHSPLKSTVLLYVILLLADFAIATCVLLVLQGPTGAFDPTSGASYLVYGLLLVSTMIVPVAAVAALCISLARWRFKTMISTIVASVVSSALLCSGWMITVGPDKDPEWIVIGLGALSHGVATYLWCFATSTSPRPRLGSWQRSLVSSLLWGTVMLSACGKSRREGEGPTNPADPEAYDVSRDDPLPRDSATRGSFGTEHSWSL